MILVIVESPSKCKKIEMKTLIPISVTTLPSFLLMGR